MNTRKKNTRQNLLDPPLVDGLLAGNLLPADKQKIPLPVVVPMWDGAPPSELAPHHLLVLWNGRPIGDVKFIKPGDADGPQHRTHNVPVDQLTEGTHTATYSVQIGTEPVRISHAQEVVIDAAAPELGPDNALQFPEVVVDEGITEEYLDENQDQVLATVPPYVEPQAGDVIQFYWDKEDGENYLLGTLPLGSPVPDPIQLAFPGAGIRERGVGTFLARYAVIDRVGHTSGFSQYVSVEVVEEDEEEEEEYPPESITPPYCSSSDRMTDDGTLNQHVLARGEGLGVWVHDWLNMSPYEGLNDTIELQWSSAPVPVPESFSTVDTMVVIAPADRNTFPRRLVIPHATLPEDGRGWVRYCIVLFNGAPTWSTAIPVICDSTAPYRNADPLPIEVPDEPITDAYFVENPTGVLCTVPDYPDWQPGDVVVVYWLNTLLDDPGAQEPAGHFVVERSPHTLRVPKAVVEATGDGGCYVVYRLIDKATNRSAASTYTKVTVALGALPDNLQPPLVPQADDGCVDLADAFDGVYVDVPPYDNWKTGDRIRLQWGDTVLEDRVIHAATVNPVRVPVPPQVLKAEYGDAKGAKHTTVRYEVLRGDLPSLPQQTTVDVDFSVIGPEIPDTDWPNPVNPGLEAPQVYGATSQTLNTLTPADALQPATVKVELYAPLNVGEVVTVWWGDKPVIETAYTIKAGDAPKDVRDIEVPWSYIEAAGNDPVLPVHYRIGAEGSPNEQRSASTPVKVEAVVIELEAPGLPDVMGNYVLCSSLRDDGTGPALRVEVPDVSAYAKAGDSITLKWLPMAGMHEGPVLPDAIKEDTLVLGPDYPVTGFIWKVQPYEDHLEPLYDRYGPGTETGRAELSYTLDYQGKPLTSKVKPIIVTLFDGGGGCRFTEDE